MSGRRPFSDLTRDFTPARRRRVDDMKRELLAEMPLHELRRARALTHRDMAKLLKVNQPACLSSTVSSSTLCPLFPSCQALAP